MKAAESAHLEFRTDRMGRALSGPLIQAIDDKFTGQRILIIEAARARLAACTQALEKVHDLVCRGLVRISENPVIWHANIQQEIRQKGQ